MDLNEWGKYFIRGLFAQELALCVLTDRFYLILIDFWYNLYVLYPVEFRLILKSYKFPVAHLTGEQRAIE